MVTRNLILVALVSCVVFVTIMTNPMGNRTSPILERRLAMVEEKLNHLEPDVWTIVLFSSRAQSLTVGGLQSHKSICMCSTILRIEIPSRLPHNFTRSSLLKRGKLQCKQKWPILPHN